MNKYMKLGDVATFMNGYAFKPADWEEQGLPIIRIQNLTSDNKNFNYYNKNYDPKYEINKGDILISWSASLGVYEWQGEKALLNQHIFKVVFDKMEVDKRFFIYAVKILLKNIENNLHGSTMKHITKPMFENLKFPALSPEKQRKIANVLDCVSNILNMKKAQFNCITDLSKFQFLKIFGDPILNEKNWKTEKLFKVAPITQYIGKFDEKIWLLNLDMIEANTGKIIKYNYTNLENIPLSTYKFSEENVLYSKLRPYLNKVVIPNNRGYVTSEMLPLKPNPLLLNRYFFAYLLRCETFVDFIKNKVSGTKMPRVSMEELKQFDCILPPIELQNKFATFVIQTEKCLFELQKSIDETQLLFDSLMDKYFS